jgi:hypothetical protein
VNNVSIDAARAELLDMAREARSEAADMPSKNTQDRAARLARLRTAFRARCLSGSLRERQLDGSSCVVVDDYKLIVAGSVAPVTIAVAPVTSAVAPVTSAVAASDDGGIAGAPWPAIDPADGVYR